MGSNHPNIGWRYPPLTGFWAKGFLNHQPVMYETNYTNLLLSPRSVFNIHLWQLLSQFGPRARGLAFPHGLPYAFHSVQVCRALGTAKIQPAAWW